MDVCKVMADEFKIAIGRFNNSPAIQLLLAGKLGVRQYKSILCEFHHYTKENPQLQGLATVYFRGSDRKLVKQFLRHAASEVGHDQMALDDFRALGGDAEKAAMSRPLPATKAFTSFAFYQISFDNPVGYLGIIYFLEYMPTQEGSRYAEALLRGGVPASALTFLQEHIVVDVGHNQLMQQYLQSMIHDQADLDAAVYAMHVAAELYGQLLWSAVERADSGIDYGINSLEAQRTHALEAESA